VALRQAFTVCLRRDSSRFASPPALTFRDLIDFALVFPHDDLPDNCALTPNPAQADSDGDGIGDACDTHVDTGGVADEIERLALVDSQNLLPSIPTLHGVNGLIAKLGGVVKKASQAIGAYEAGTLTTAAYVAALEDVLGQLDSYDAQLAAKIANRQIPAAAGAEFAAISAEIRRLLDLLTPARDQRAGAVVPRKAATAALYSTGQSSCTVWPQPRSSTSRAPGMARPCSMIARVRPPCMNGLGMSWSSEP
jgi:hypothetical protein